MVLDVQKGNHLFLAADLDLHEQEHLFTTCLGLIRFQPKVRISRRIRILEIVFSLKCHSGGEWLLLEKRNAAAVDVIEPFKKQI